MQEGIPNEEIAKAMQTRQTIKSCRELITAIDAEILVGCKMVSDNVRARIQILTALEREYYEWSLKLASHQYKMGPKHLQEEYWKEHEGIIMTLRTVKEKMANIVDN